MTPIKTTILLKKNEYVGSWLYNDSKKEITFTAGSKYPTILSLEKISDDEINLSNPITK